MTNASIGSIRERAFEIIFGGSKRFDTALLALILLSVTVVMLDSAIQSDSAWSSRIRMIEIGFTLIFTVEYLIRLWCHPRPGHYARSPFGIIDFLAIIPTYAAFLIPGWETLAVLRVLRVLRILRILELGRFSRAAELISTALSAARYKIGVFATIVGLVVMIAGAFMYMLEGPGNGFTSIPTAAYWAIATLTTVGHPDLSPATPAGQIFASFMMILGYAFIAIPVGIITSEVVAAQNTLSEILDAVAATMTAINVQEFDGRKVCLLEVQRSPDPIYLRTSKNPKTFFVRVNNSTRELTGPDMVSYIRNRWN